MSLAIARYQSGRTVMRAPVDLLTHLVAVRYGVAPDQVRAWAADDFLTAVRLLPVTEGADHGRR